MRRQTKRFFVFILIIAMLLFAVIHNLTLKITGKDLVTTFFDNPWLEERKYLIQEYSKDRNNVVNLKSVCPVPDLNPFSKDVIHLMKSLWEMHTQKIWEDYRQEFYIGRTHFS